MNVLICIYSIDFILGLEYTNFNYKTFLLENPKGKYTVCAQLSVWLCYNIQDNSLYNVISTTANYNQQNANVLITLQNYSHSCMLHNHL